MPDLNTIPATKSDDELAALKAADPAAFDLDEAPPQTDEERAAAESADKEAADAAAKAEAEKAEAAKDEAVDRRKFDGVLGDLRDTRATLAQERARAEALAAEVAAPVITHVTAAPAAAPVAESAAAPVAQAVATPAAATSGLPKVASYQLPLDSLQEVAQTSGLVWVNSDADKIAAVQAAIAAEPAILCDYRILTIGVRQSDVAALVAAT